MITDDGLWECCDIPDCDEKIRNHRWGRTKSVGWYFTKSGRAFCPRHTPHFKKVERYGA